MVVGHVFERAVLRGEIQGAYCASVPTFAQVEEMERFALSRRGGQHSAEGHAARAVASTAEHTEASRVLAPANIDVFRLSVGPHKRACGWGKVSFRTVAIARLEGDKYTSIGGGVFLFLALAKAQGQS